MNGNKIYRFLPFLILNYENSDTSLIVSAGFSPAVQQILFSANGGGCPNALFGGTVNNTGYNGVFKAGLSNKWFRADVFYETFAELNYNSGGMNLNGLLNYDRKFKQGAGIQMSLIDKPNKLTPSLGLNGLLEYHFGYFFASTRAEIKMRTDWDITVFSGFVGVGFKI